MPKFKKIYVEILNYCNFNCGFCPKTERERGVLSVENFKNVALQAKAFADTFCLHLCGEPTLHPEFKEILGVCGELKVKVELVTNGGTLNEVSEVLLNSPAVKKICFSLNAYGEIGGGQAEEFLKFARLAGEAGKVVEFRFFDKSKIPQFFLEARNAAGGRANEIAPNVFVRVINRFKWPVQAEKGKDGGKTFCLGGRTHIGILCCGTVVPCCLDNNAKIPLGNVFETNLENILRSDRFLNLIKGFSEGRAVEGLCKTCGFEKK